MPDGLLVQRAIGLNLTVYEVFYDKTLLLRLGSHHGPLRLKRHLIPNRHYRTE